MSIEVFGVAAKSALTALAVVGFGGVLSVGGAEASEVGITGGCWEKPGISFSGGTCGASVAPVEYVRIGRHEFDVKAPVVSYNGSVRTTIWQISHKLSFRPDDQVTAYIDRDAFGNVQVRSSIERGGLSQLLNTFMPLTGLEQSLLRLGGSVVDGDWTSALPELYRGLIPRS